MLGGGTPKNFINQASVQAEFYDDRVGGHRYAIQIVTDVPYYGGASGSSLEEAQSWGKLATDAEQVTVHADVTIALPLLVTALESSARDTLATRNRLRFDLSAACHGHRWETTTQGAFRGTLMSFPFEYDHGAPLAFGGALPHVRVIRRIQGRHSSRTCRSDDSYIPGTRNGPREILQASSHMELWDEEVGTDVHAVGIFTLPEMELPFGELAPLMDEIKRVASEILSRDKFLVTLGGEHSITPPLVAAAATKYPGLSVLQIDAHADLRDCYMGTTHNHACAMRRTLEHAPLDAGRHPQHVHRGSGVAPSLKTTIFYDVTMRDDPAWIDRVVSTLRDPVYITIDVDGMDPAIMPSTGTPEPGGLSWYETLALLRADHSSAAGGRLRRRRTQSDPGSARPELPLREAGLQNSDLSICRA